MFISGDFWWYLCVDSDAADDDDDDGDGDDDDDDDDDIDDGDVDCVVDGDDHDDHDDDEEKKKMAMMMPQYQSRVKLFGALGRISTQWWIQQSCSLCVSKCFQVAIVAKARQNTNYIV